MVDDRRCSIDNDGDITRIKGLGESVEKSCRLATKSYVSLARQYCSQAYLQNTVARSTCNNRFHHWSTIDQVDFIIDGQPHKIRVLYSLGFCDLLLCHRVSPMSSPTEVLAVSKVWSFGQLGRWSYSPKA